MLVHTRRQYIRQEPCNKFRSRVLRLSHLDYIKPLTEFTQRSTKFHINLNQKHVLDMPTQDYLRASPNRLPT